MKLNTVVQASCSTSGDLPILYVFQGPLQRREPMMGFVRDSKNAQESSYKQNENCLVLQHKPPVANPSLSLLVLQWEPMDLLGECGMVPEILPSFLADSTCPEDRPFSPSVFPIWSTWLQKFLSGSWPSWPDQIPSRRQAMSELILDGAAKCVDLRHFRPGRFAKSGTQAARRGRKMGTVPVGEQW